jgi:protein-S-isoprenylcysteine O-methyltransferase Ste14
MTDTGAGPRVPPLAICAAAVVAQRFLTRDPRTGLTNRAVGAAVGTMSAGMLVSSVAAFRWRRTTVDPRAGAEPSALVTDGVNACTRNPMYVGMAGMLLAHSVWLGRAPSLLPAVAFVIWIDRLQVPAEENGLREIFAVSYDEYVALAVPGHDIGSGEPG